MKESLEKYLPLVEKVVDEYQNQGRNWSRPGLTDWKLPKGSTTSGLTSVSNPMPSGGSATVSCKPLLRSQNHKSSPLLIEFESEEKNAYVFVPFENIVYFCSRLKHHLCWWIIFQKSGERFVSGNSAPRWYRRWRKGIIAVIPVDWSFSETTVPVADSRQG